MAFNNSFGPGGSPTQMQRPGGPPAPQAPSALWKELSAKRFNPNTGGRKRTFLILSVILLIMVIFAGVRISTVTGTTNDQITIHIANQQDATLDLRSGFRISPQLLGANVFPKTGSHAVGQNFSGFMNYSNRLATGFKDMHVKLMRFPGGDWGEHPDRQYSLDQLTEFSKFAAQSGAEAMIHVRLNQIRTQDGDPLVHTDLDFRANEAGRLVDFMNNPGSKMRNGRTNNPKQPTKLWAVGNEPDLMKNPVTKKVFTVQEYAQAFIQYSNYMHQNDPTIRVFGPEISQYYGVGNGPYDATGQEWMDGFLKAIADYERKNPNQNYKILDGVSFHRYPLSTVRQEPGILLSNANEWNYTLPGLREQIKQEFGRELPLAITEINVTPAYKNEKFYQPSRGFAALWWADTLGTLMNQQVSYVAFFSASGVPQPYPLFDQDSQRPGTEKETAMGRVMQLFGRLQNNMIPLAIQHDPVAVYATQDDAHNTVSLLLVNKSPTQQLAQINASTQIASVGPWRNLNVKLAKYSITVVTLHRNSDGAEAYSFLVPDQNSPTVAPINSTICGEKKDTVDPNISC
jgi:hypothetical protein